MSRSSVSKLNLSAYFEALPRSVSITAILPVGASAVANVRAVNVLPLPDVPMSASRNLASVLVAFLNVIAMMFNKVPAAIPLAIVR